MLKLAGALILIYAAAVAFLAIFQRSFIYHPPRIALDQRALRAAEYEALDQPVRGPATLWFAGPRAPESWTIVFLHGNSGDIAGAIGKVSPLRAAGYGVLLVEYPGFSQVAGRPTQLSIVAQATMALRALEARGVGGDRVVLWGESLGTGVAIQLAADHQIGGLILEAAFTAVADRAQEIYWWMPARRLVLDRFDSLARIRDINAPILLVHGEQDRVTPPDHGRRLLAAANEPKRGVFFPSGGHVDLVDHGLMSEILRFLAESPARPAR